MSDTLSQEEVDALRQAVANGVALEEAETTEVEEKKQAHVKVVTYDFRKPHLLSADQRHAVERLHDGLMKSLQTRMTAFLRQAIEIKLVALDQISYGEFELSAANPSYLALLQTEPDVGAVALELSVSVVAAMIEVMLGGGKNFSDVKSLTDLDIEMFSEAVQTLCLQLGEDWSAMNALSFRVARTEANPEYLQLTTRETACMNAAADVRIGSVSGVLNICYPIGFIQRMFSALERRTGRADAEQSRNTMLKALGPVPIGMRAVLGGCVLSARDVCILKPGDVVCIERDYDEPVDVMVGSHRAFSAQIGKRRQQLAVSLLERARLFGESA